ncbi:hypothetical protein ARNL5_00904 [Anaerolineae bacterium]|nr:hypothetical protein ARNL5_00904 [Anaerolineae bacterium]
MQFDVFNGDADGLCALLQYRLAKPCTSELVTGVKRDIVLLEKVHATQGDSVTVLDVSLAKNRVRLERLLGQGVRVFYVDHHQAGEIPKHALLTTLINTDAKTCTSLLMNEYLQGQYLEWAIVGALGDNLTDVALQLGAEFSAQELKQLQQLGVCLNYNGYGKSIEDLHFAPEVLFQYCIPYASPFDFIAEQNAIFQTLIHAYHDDLNAAFTIKSEFENNKVAIFVLPNTAWARRVSGVFSNELANRFPNRAHAVLNDDVGVFQVSVRAPLNNPTGADELCASFSTGGGRKSAAGINQLPAEHKATFIQAFIKKFS